MQELPVNCQAVTCSDILHILAVYDFDIFMIDIAFLVIFCLNKYNFNMTIRRHLSLNNEMNVCVTYLI